MEDPDALPRCGDRPGYRGPDLRRRGRRKRIHRIRQHHQEIVYQLLAQVAATLTVLADNRIQEIPVEKFMWLVPGGITLIAAAGAGTSPRAVYVARPLSSC